MLSPRPRHAALVVVPAPRFPRALTRTAWLVAAGLAILVAAALLHGPRAVSPRPQRAAAARPLAAALRADGSLAASRGSFDARGYRMVVGRDGAPRFVRAA